MNPVSEKRYDQAILGGADLKYFKILCLIYKEGGYPPSRFCVDGNVPSFVPDIGAQIFFWGHGSNPAQGQIYVIPLHKCLREVTHYQGRVISKIQASIIYATDNATGSTANWIDNIRGSSKHKCPNCSTCMIQYTNFSNIPSMYIGFGYL